MSKINDAEIPLGNELLCAKIYKQLGTHGFVNWYSSYLGDI